MRWPQNSVGLLLSGVVVAQCCTHTAAAAELCRFTGITEPAGQIAAAVRVAAMDGVTQVDVTLTFDTTWLLWLRVRYLVEEISTWRNSQLQSVAVNIRSLVASHIVRQQWDVFRRAPHGLEAYRVQAKSLADLQRRHPGFVRHWDPASFGQSWLSDYPSAAPERRPDLDLKAAAFPTQLHSPLALAFYGVRWLPRAGEDVPVFLPGFKKQRLVDLSITSAVTTGGLLWQAPLQYPEISPRPASTATAWTSPDHHLQQLAIELYTPHGSGRALIDQQGCEGVSVPSRDQ